LINSFLHPVAADTGEERTFCKKKKSRSKEKMIGSSEKKNLMDAKVASAKEPEGNSYRNVSIIGHTFNLLQIFVHEKKIFRTVFCILNM
jgi:ribosomal protein S8E